MRRFAALLVGLIVSAPVQTKDLLPTYSLRELSYRAEVVVLAAPLDALAQGKFKVTQVLRGSGVKPGDTIALTEEDMQFYFLRQIGSSGLPKMDGEPVAITEALVYLGSGQQGGRWAVVRSGLRFGTATGDVLTPQQITNPGTYRIAVQEGRMWESVVKEAQAAAAAVEEVLQLKAAAGKQRTAGLLRWIERHRLEFGGGFYDGERAGWGSLETDVFDWICEQGQPEECWAAAKLYAELNHGAAQPLKGPNFGTPAGRDFLLRIALDEQALDGDRARALTLLSSPYTLNPPRQDGKPGVGPGSDDQLRAIVKKLMSLVEGKSDVLRIAALNTMRALLPLGGSNAPLMNELKEALPVLVKAYKAEKPGRVRDVLVESIHRIGGPDHWKQVAGGATGLAVLLNDFGPVDQHLVFWLQVLPDKEKMYECPTLVLEHLGPDKVLETKTMPLPILNPPRWEEGWTPGELLAVQIPRGSLRGTWRVSVRGTVGKDKIKWESEPRLFAGPPMPDWEGRYRDKEGLRYVDKAK